MAEKTQWHPLLAQFLKRDYGEQLQIRDSVPLGKMPLEIDLLIKPKVSIESLPYPFNYLGKTTIAEFKGPEDTVNWKVITQIEGYACLYQRLNSIKDRRQITLWLIASEFTKSLNQFPCDYIDNLTKIDHGLKEGSLLRFPIYLVNLETLPITLHTIPLLVVYGGNLEREKQIIRFIIKHRSELQEYLEFLPLHVKAFREVLNEMDTKYLREMDIDWDAVADTVGKMARMLGPQRTIEAIGKTIGTEKVIETIGQKKVLETIGQEKVLETIGQEKVLDSILTNLTREQKKKLIEQLSQS